MIIFPAKYKVLSKSVFKSGEFQIVPIRYKDRLDIMKWRNEQMYHLRQDKLLTQERQDNYFKNVIGRLFEEEKPKHLLFSYLKDENCIGYGGLVHINWHDRNAEISFVMNTELEKDCFEFHWKTYLNLIEKVAFLELRLHKIFTYAFDLRPELYKTIEKVGFTKEAVLKEHCFLDEKFIDVIIHEKMNKEDKCFLRRIDESDVKTLFDWANDNMVRKNALHSDPILWKKHMTWFKKKMDSTETFIYILETSNAKIGQVRIDSENGYWTIDYSISKEFRGKGYGKLMIMLLLKKVVKKPLLALVKENNIPSQKVFEELEFKKSKNSKNDLIKYIYE